MIGLVQLGPTELALAALLLVLNGALSVALRLELARRIAVAALRAVVQLLLIGFVLEWVFATRAWPAVVGMGVVMALLAGLEAVRRTRHRVPGLYATSILVTASTSMAVALYGVAAVLRVEPWYEPQFLIPILGMILGNALNGVSLGLDGALAGFRSERLRIEVLLAHGATRSEATRAVVRRSVRTGMVPILHSMAAAGLISIPGMMTGQILAGEAPITAALYQVFILFTIAGAAALGTVGVVLGATRLVFDERERLRPERIRTLS